MLLGWLHQCLRRLGFCLGLRLLDLLLCCLRRLFDSNFGHLLGCFFCLLCLLHGFLCILDSCLGCLLLGLSCDRLPSAHELGPGCVLQGAGLHLGELAILLEELRWSHTRDFVLEVEKLEQLLLPSILCSNRSSGRFLIGFRSHQGYGHDGDEEDAHCEHALVPPC